LSEVVFLPSPDGPGGHRIKEWRSVGPYCALGNRHPFCTQRVKLAYREYHICTCPCHDADTCGTTGKQIL
jgi:hypothetical protein